MYKKYLLPLALTLLFATKKNHGFTIPSVPFLSNSVSNTLNKGKTENMAPNTSVLVPLSIDRAFLSARIEKGRRLVDALKGMSTREKYNAGHFDTLMLLVTLSSLGRPVQIQFNPSNVHERTQTALKKMPSYYTAIQKALPEAINDLIALTLKTPKYNQSLNTEKLYPSDDYEHFKLSILRIVAPFICRLNQETFNPLSGDCRLKDTTNPVLLEPSPFMKLIYPNETTVLKLNTNITTQLSH